MAFERPVSLGKLATIIGSADLLAPFAPCGRALTRKRFLLFAVASSALALAICDAGWVAGWAGLEFGAPIGPEATVSTTPVEV